MGVLIGAISLSAFAQGAPRVGFLELKLKSVRSATTTVPESIDGAKVTAWTVVEIEPSSPLLLTPTSGTQAVLFLGDSACWKAWRHGTPWWRAGTLWCVRPKVSANEAALWGPVHVPLTTPPEVLSELREAAKKNGLLASYVAAVDNAALTPEKIQKLRASAPTWRLDGVEEKAPLAAESLRELIRKLESEAEL